MAEIVDSPEEMAKEYRRRKLEYEQYLRHQLIEEGTLTMRKKALKETNASLDAIIATKNALLSVKELINVFCNAVLTVAETANTADDTAIINALKAAQKTLKAMHDIEETIQNSLHTTQDAAHTILEEENFDIETLIAKLTEEYDIGMSLL